MVRKCAYCLGCAVLAAALGLLLGAPARAASDAAEIVPEEALARLKNGNTRFADGQPRNPHRNAARRSETARQGQRPMATVIACSDSRVPVELLLDQGIGDVFVIRVAGNVCNTDEIGSAEYGVDHLGTPLLVVIGHSQCGAVTAVATNAALHGHVAALVEPIKPAVAKAQKDHPDLQGKELVPAAIEANVWQSLENLFAKSATVRKRAIEGKLRVEGAVYDLESGRVQWLGAHPRQKQFLEDTGGEERAP